VALFQLTSYVFYVNESNDAVQQAANTISMFVWWL